MLNTPDTYFDTSNPDRFWEGFNKPFLDEAIARSDDVVLASNPTLNKLYRVNAKGEFIDDPNLKFGVSAVYDLLLLMR